MIVLHAHWSTHDHALHIWGEHDAPLRDSAHIQIAGSRVHPRALDEKELRTLIKATFRARITLLPKLGGQELTLPTAKYTPAAPPELPVAEHAVARQLSNWQVATIALAPNSAFEVLIDLAEQLQSEPEARSLVYGASLKYWARMAEFALELITAQRFIPTVQPATANAPSRALWQAAFNDDDIGQLRVLAGAMPPICRAHAPDAQPGELVQDFVHALTDAFVREHAAGNGKSLAAQRRALQLPGNTDAWFAGLLAKDGEITLGNNSELFIKDLNGWLAQVRAAPASAFRTCFRLEPPVVATGARDNGNEWRVSFHLQANDDRSLLVPAEQIWHKRGEASTLLKRKLANPQEHLLRDLGHAARMFPQIDDALRAARPTEVTLDTTQAYGFMRDSAPLLEQSGFGVLMPPWWNKASAKFGVKLKVKGASKTTGNGIMGFNAVVDYDWNIAIGDQTLSYAEFEQLAKLKMPLVNVRGQWVELKPEDVEKAIQFFKKKGDAMTLGEAMQLGLGAGENEAGFTVISLEGEGWVKDVLAKLQDNARLPMLDTPDTFQGTLRPYQQRGLSWLAFLRSLGMGACLADDMGLGKTPQTLAYLLAHRSEGQRTKTLEPRSESPIANHPSPLCSSAPCPSSATGNARPRNLRRACT